MRTLHIGVAAAATLLSITALAPAQASAPGDNWCETTVTVKDIGVREPVEFYYGSPDDKKGTHIQNTGILSAPVGPKGGSAGPGGVGNFFIAGHRNSHGGVLNDILDLRKGDTITVNRNCVDGTKSTFVYEVNGKARYIDFFTKKGREAQLAETPFKPSVRADKAYITLSTCATQEDRARGDRRTDQFGNPPGRFVVVGELVNQFVKTPKK